MDFSKNILSKALTSIFESMKGKQSTGYERSQIEQMADSIIDSKENNSDESIDDLDDETKQLLLDEEIEQVAHAIRIIVVDMVDAINGNSSFYEVKRALPLIKESHSIVMKYYSTDLFPKIIKYAKTDMFKGDMRILGKQTQYKKFFSEYINNPYQFSILMLKERASHDLIAYLEEAQVFEA